MVKLLDRINGVMIVWLIRLPFNKPFTMYMEYTIKFRLWYARRNMLKVREEEFEII
jgi:hypothetical protein